MRAIYSWLRAQPLNDNVVAAICALAALAVLAIDLTWGLPQ